MTIRLILFYFDIKSAGQNVWTGNADTGTTKTACPNGMPSPYYKYYMCIQE